MTVAGHRKLRLFFKFGLLVCLPVTGYLWAQSGISVQSIVMSAVCVVMALGAEGLASSGESKLFKLRESEHEAERIFETEAQSRDERLRQMDRIIETLSNQNHDLRGRLVSIHGEVHRVNEEMAELRPATPAEPAETSEEQAASEDGGADVTDISSLRRR